MGTEFKLRKKNTINMIGMVNVGWAYGVTVRGLVGVFTFNSG